MARLEIAVPGANDEAVFSPNRQKMAFGYGNG
jgi:hypothetical protein